MSDLLMHLIIDGLPVGSEPRSHDGAAIMRVVSAPALGARYNRLFLFKNLAQLNLDLDSLIGEVNTAVLSQDDSDRACSSPACLKLQQHGATLFRELNESSKQLMEALLQQALYNQRSLLLLLQFGDGARDLASCQWEALFDETTRRFLLLDGTVARYVPAGRAPAAPSRALRVLVATSTYGTDGGIDQQASQYAEADLEGLQRSLHGLRANGIVEQVTVLRNPSQNELHDALRDDVNLLHFFGHGGVDPERGEYLVLRGPRPKDTGKCAYFDQLQQIFQPAATPHLRLVVINACQLEEQARLGARLVGGFGIPAVITMKARIGQEVIADRHGFTETLYRHIAAGRAVHEAYHSALNSIWFASPLEMFVPTLTLGIDEPLVLVDPTEPATQQVRLENQQRRQPIQDIIESIRQAWGRLDHEELAADLNMARRYAQDPQLAEVIGDIFEGVKGEMERQRNARQWTQALRCSNTLNSVAELLPEERQKESNRLTQNLQSALDADLQALKNSAQSSRLQRRWPDVLRSVEQYLQLKSDDAEVRNWLAEARECVSLERSIVTVDETAEVNAAFSRLENLLSTGDIKAAEALLMSVRKRLAPRQAAAFHRQILLGKGEHARQKGDWYAARGAAEDLLQIDPGNIEAGEIISEALLEDAATFLRAGQHEEAEAKCNEAAGFAAQPGRVIEFRQYLFLDRIQKLRGKGDWPEVERVCKQVLTDPQLTSIHVRAKGWEREAVGYRKLWDQIQIVG